MSDESKGEPSRDQAEIPPMRDIPDNLDDKLIVEIEEYGVFEWHAEKDGKGKPSMIVLMLTLKDTEDIRFGLRFHSAKAVNELVTMLRRHRDLVWP